MPVPIDTSFWGNALEVNAELIVKEHEDEGLVRDWVDSIDLRARSVLTEHFEIGNELSLAQQRMALFDRREQLLPFALAEAAIAFKRQYAILEVAKSKLDDGSVQRCFISGEKYDRLALSWLLFIRDPKNLELVAHLDRVHRNGFARMVLSAHRGCDNPDIIGAFLRRETIQKILDDFEAQEKSRKESHCAAVLSDGGNYRVFVKRDYRSAFVSRGEENTFGYEPEWIVLEFEPDLRRVHVCSVSADIPAKLANEIARVFFQELVTYENESVVTHEEKVRGFLASLLDDSDAPTLVEFVGKNCGLEGGPQLRLNMQDDRPLGPALRNFGNAVGDVFARLEDIESIKILFAKKRVRVIFDVPDGDGAGFEVRYGDQPLNGKERREFEQLMESRYQICVLSTEKRRAQ